MLRKAGAKTDKAAVKAEFEAVISRGVPGELQLAPFEKFLREAANGLDSSPR